MQTLISITKTAAALLAGESTLQTSFGTKSLNGVKSMIKGTYPLPLLENIESFLSGFEDDESQEGVKEMLDELRELIETIKLG